MSKNQKKSEVCGWTYRLDLMKTVGYVVMITLIGRKISKVCAFFPSALTHPKRFSAVKKQCENDSFRHRKTFASAILHVYAGKDIGICLVPAIKVKLKNKTSLFVYLALWSHLIGSGIKKHLKHGVGPGSTETNVSYHNFTNVCLYRLPSVKQLKVCYSSFSILDGDGNPCLWKNLPNAFCLSYRAACVFSLL